MYGERAWRRIKDQVKERRIRTGIPLGKQGRQGLQRRKLRLGIFKELSTKCFWPQMEKSKYTSMMLGGW